MLHIWGAWIQKEGWIRSLRIRREEGREERREEGIEKLWEEGRKEGGEEGITECLKEGREEVIEEEKSRAFLMSQFIIYNDVIQWKTV